MKLIRMRLIEIDSFMIASDCVRFFDRTADSDALINRQNTIDMLTSEMKKRPEYTNKAIEVRYCPIKHIFTAYIKQPYVAGDTMDVLNKK